MQFPLRVVFANRVTINNNLLPNLYMQVISCHLLIIFSTAINATKLYVTMHIRNVTNDDDSQNGLLGRYECHAFAVNDNQGKKHGFTVNVISSKYYQYIYILTVVSL